MTWGLGSASSLELENSSSLSLATVIAEELWETAEKRKIGEEVRTNEGVKQLTSRLLSLELSQLAAVDITGGTGDGSDGDVVLLKLTCQLAVRHLGDISKVLLWSG